MPYVKMCFQGRIVIKLFTEHCQISKYILTSLCIKVLHLLLHYLMTSTREAVYVKNWLGFPLPRHFFFQLLQWNTQAS